MPRVNVCRLSWLAAICVFAGCGTAPDLRPRLILAGDPVTPEFYWHAAPYVAVVKVTRADLVGPRQAEYVGGPKTLQLVKFSADVENVIKGDLRAGATSFYYFVKDDERNSFYLDPGERYIVSLRREGSVLRSWTDASQLKIKVFSGVHEQKELPLDGDVKATIQYILLTPGSQCDLRVFAETIGQGLSYYGNPREDHRYIERLEAHPSRSVREWACIAEASHWWYRPKCLQACLTSPSEPIRKRAAELLNAQDAEYWLKKNPYFYFSDEWIEYMTQVFELYTKDMRPGVRAAACTQLRVFGEDSADKNCR
jgi:hypothetical protein